MLGGLTSAPEPQVYVLGKLRAFPLFSAFRPPHKVQSLPWGLSINRPIPRGPLQVSALGGMGAGDRSVIWGESLTLWSSAILNQ